MSREKSALMDLNAVLSALEWHLKQEPPTCLTLMPASVSWYVPGGDPVVVKHDGTPQGALAAMLNPETRKPRMVKRDER